MDNLSPFQKLAITKKIGLLLLLPACGAVVALGAFYLYLHQTASHVHFVNVAGRQRMLTQQLFAYANMVMVGQEENRKPLRVIVDTFERTLRTLEQGGQVMEQTLPPAPREVLDEIAATERLWVRIKDAFVVIADRPASDPQAQAAYKYVHANIDGLTKSSDRIVTAFEARINALRREMFNTLVVIAGLDLVLVLVGLRLSRRYIAGPILTIERAARQIQVGDFSHRVPILTRDELATLANTFNEMSESRARTEARLQQTADSLKESEDRYRHLVESSPEAIVVSSEGEIVYVNPAGAKLAGAANPEGLLGKPLLDLVHPDYLETAEEFIDQTYRNCDLEPEPAELKVVRLDGQVIDIEVTGLAILFAGNPVLQIVAHNITERKRAEEARARLATILEATTDLVAFSDAEGQVLYINPAGRKMAGIAEDEDITKLMMGDKLAVWAKEIVRAEGIPTAKRDGVWSGETALMGSDGHEIPISQLIMAHKAPDGTVECLSTIARDLTERKQFEARLVYLADHDALTGLYSRRRFQQELSRQINYAVRYRRGGAVLFLDLDNFKYVNDTLGHRAGDGLLTSLAGRLRIELQETDILARLGGDEFAILLPEGDAGQAQAVADRILRAVEQNDFAVEGQPIRITASIGIALFPDHGKTAEDLLAHADLAMYRAKGYGRNRVCMHTPDDDQHAKMQSNFTWLARIRDALERDRFELFLQPILNLEENRISQYEVLLRMVGDAGEVIMPGAFLDVAERFGLIRDIDRWVVRRAIRLIAENQRADVDLNLEINLSGKAFSDPELLNLIHKELEATSINPRNLVFEITETAACDNLTEAQQFIVALKSLGCRFGLDDFGVGFSSFNYLKHLPVDYLKIDGSFIRNLPEDPVDQHLVKAMIEVAHGLGKLTIAEFVENEDTVHFLKQYGVDYAQGYHIGRPAAVSRILSDVASRPAV